MLSVEAKTPKQGREKAGGRRTRVPPRALRPGVGGGAGRTGVRSGKRLGETPPRVWRTSGWQESSLRVTASPVPSSGHLTRLSGFWVGRGHALPSTVEAAQKAGRAVKWELFMLSFRRAPILCRRGGKKPQPKARGRGASPHPSQSTPKSHWCWRGADGASLHRVMGRGQARREGPPAWFARPRRGPHPTPPPAPRPGRSAQSCFCSRPRGCGQRCPPISCSHGTTGCHVTPFSVRLRPRASLCPQTPLLPGSSCHWASATLTVFLVMHMKHSGQKATGGSGR